MVHLGAAYKVTSAVSQPLYGVRGAARVPVERTSPAKLMQLATDVGPAPMQVGAVVVLEAGCIPTLAGGASDGAPEESEAHPAGPIECRELLFDDVIWVGRVSREHGRFAEVVRDTVLPSNLG
jgi:hypothetical protein